MKLRPAPTKASRTSNEVGWSAVQPKTFPPSMSGATSSIEFPSCRFFIGHRLRSLLFYRRKRRRSRRWRRFQMTFRNSGGIDESPGHGAAADLSCTVVRRNAKDVKASRVGFKHSLGLHSGANASGSAMFNVDRRPHADLAFFAVGQQGIGGGPLHEADHIGRGVDRGQRRIVIAQRMAVLYCLFRMAANAEGNWFGHGKESIRLGHPSRRKKRRLGIPGHWQIK